MWQRAAIRRAITLALLGACVALGGWMYLRDRPPTNLQQGSVRAQVDGERILTLLGGDQSCHYECAIEVLGKTGPQAWRVQLTAPSWQRCFDVNVATFEYSDDHGGLNGLRSVSCR
jgi:hypothetical protein